MNYKNYFFDLGNTLTISADFSEAFSEVKYPDINANSFKEVGSVFEKTLSSYF